MTAQGPTSLKEGGLDFEEMGISVDLISMADLAFLVWASALT